MSDTLLTVIFIVVYFIGVLVSMTLVAYINRDGEELPEPISILSWVFVLGILVVFPLAYFMAWPFEKLQEYLNNKFKKK